MFTIFWMSILSMFPEESSSTDYKTLCDFPISDTSHWQDKIKISFPLFSRLSKRSTKWLLNNNIKRSGTQGERHQYWNKTRNACVNCYMLIYACSNCCMKSYECLDCCIKVNACLYRCIKGYVSLDRFMKGYACLDFCMKSYACLDCFYKRALCVFRLFYERLCVFRLFL